MVLTAVMVSLLLGLRKQSTVGGEQQCSLLTKGHTHGLTY